ncbi:endonuclease/exonuclease/phosphatase family protein [Salegentibacter sp. F188]|uniref:Endonuclease/exonuclease/phosphatase family protein n=1 Tax=Autumnicola patrickiae TaxID=3075591 RepID=A0ABU3E5B7_9FLAO|nr:endonuclease/exonuclease/phosphatase family protein [Salegentibacter sp. F188]MDT0691196.1 endonuclease/exonuclease/phosphatase family protein [Salegentibacter sp. F188]
MNSLKPLYLRALVVWLIFFPSRNLMCQEQNSFNILSVAFYNVENLFDTEDDPFTFDDDRTPTGKDVWTEEKYSDKIAKISKVLSEIGSDVTGSAPAIIGLCEFENREVLETLIAHPNLSAYNYGIIHFDSPDRRGIDVGLIYKKDIFAPVNSESRRLMIYEAEDPSKRVYTRDQLVASGMLEGEEIHFIVNHWPSRSGGEAKSSYRREKAAALNKKIIDSLYEINPYSKVVSMGDFNDDPANKSFKKILKTKASKENLKFQELYNPMEKMLKEGHGTLAYRDSWNLFDQIFMSRSLAGSDYSSYQFYRAGIFNKDFLVTPGGQYKGYPFRSYGYGGYTGGYSDHFPVYIYLIKETAPYNSPGGVE